MNREEAIKIFSGIASLAKINTEPTMSVCNVKNEVFTEILQALLVSQPDPITGLVPCGCGGKAAVKKGVNHRSGYYVICEKCECNIGLDRDDFLRPFGAYPTAEQAVSDWNRAIGWKGGAE